MANIKVVLHPKKNIEVVLKPKQGIKIDSSNKYLYDPTLIQKYVDASREYSEEARISEANAKASEMNAELSAEQAKASEDNVKLSESRAKESELKAKTSENNAKESETKARQDANASAESAYQSQQSALASYEYSQNAEADAQNVQETLDYILVSETKIAQSEKNIKQSELNAKASETKATQEANASAESAYQSQQSALASYQYSSNAEADAQNANESLDKVLESLDKVLISEANAKASENVALDSADVAKTKSQEALQSANTATEKADEASQFALECQAIKDSLGSVYVFRGAVNTASELPDNAQVGDVYDVKDTGINYAWNGTEWDALGVTVDFDLSEYATKSELDNKVSKNGDTISGNLEMINGSLYLCGIGGSVASSTSKLVLGTPGNEYVYLTGNTSKVFGIYTGTGSSKKGIACYPGTSFFADANSKSTTLGRPQNLWQTCYTDRLSNGSVSAETGDIVKHISDVQNPHKVTAEQVGLGNVDNTSDADKPLSTATQNSLQNIRADFMESDSELQTQINGQATAINDLREQLNNIGTGGGSGITIRDWSI